MNNELKCADIISILIMALLLITIIGVVVVTYNSIGITYDIVFILYLIFEIHTHIHTLLFINVLFSYSFNFLL